MSNVCMLRHFLATGKIEIRFLEMDVLNHAEKLIHLQKTKKSRCPGVMMATTDFTTLSATLNEAQ